MKKTSGLGYNPVRGEAHHSSKLTAEKVKAIRIRYADGGISYDELAEEHGVSRTAIYDCVKFRAWKHVR